MIDATKWPELKKAWDAYGHDIPFEKLYGAKTDGRGCYVVVAWEVPPESRETPAKKLALADLARTGPDAPWEMQNDGMSPDITEAEWRKVRIEPDCDNFYIPGHKDYTSWGGR